MKMYSTKNSLLLKQSVLHIRRVGVRNLQQGCRCLTAPKTSIDNQLIPVETNVIDAIDRKFIPMTRRTLVRKILGYDFLVQPDEKELFSTFSKHLEARLSLNFHGVLAELKQLYDPLNPDKETMIMQHYGPKERRDNEFLLLDKLAEQLKNANFQELTREHIASALEEHPVYEGVLVHVDLKDYDVLRVWALSEEERPLHANNFFEKARNFVNVRLKKWPKKIKTYKRVVLAIRTKNQNKLMLKAFKDIPQNGLEYFVPEGKITMSKFNKDFIGVTAGIGVVSFLIKIVSALNDYQISFPYVVGGITGLLALKSWNAYQNKRNQYLVNLSKSLYFKSIANNRALLTLIVDRAEDEIFKSALLAYSFIRTENILKAASNTTEMSDSTSQSNGPKFSITMDELKIAVDSWMDNRYKIEIDFHPELALKELEAIGLLKVRKLGTNIHLSVPPLEAALDKLPPVVDEQMLLGDAYKEEDLEVEDIFPENDLEIMDTAEKHKEQRAEDASPGWRK